MKELQQLLVEICAEACIVKNVFPFGLCKTTLPQKKQSKKLNFKPRDVLLYSDELLPLMTAQTHHCQEILHLTTSKV